MHDVMPTTSLAPVNHRDLSSWSTRASHTHRIHATTLETNSHYLYTELYFCFACWFTYGRYHQRARCWISYTQWRSTKYFKCAGTASGCRQLPNCTSRTRVATGSCICETWYVLFPSFAFQCWSPGRYIQSAGHRSCTIVFSEWT